MIYLLDVNVLLAGIWRTHLHHTRVFDWLIGKDLAVCPISELGFIRISTNRNALRFPMATTRKALNDFCTQRTVTRISDDLAALDSFPQKSEEVTDVYLAELAAKHGMKLAALDAGLKHSAAHLI